MIRKFVDNEAGKEVRFTVDQAERVGVRVELQPQLQSSLDSVAKEGGVNLVRMTGEETHRNKRMRIVKSNANRFPPGAQGFDDVAARRLPDDFTDFVAKNPGVSPEHSSILILLEDDLKRKVLICHEKK